MEASTPPAQPLQRRKNGFEASCENCRKAKARCDHQYPCSRCTRQGKQCLFHPAPMSNKRTPSSGDHDHHHVSTAPAVGGVQEPSMAWKRPASSPLWDARRLPPPQPRESSGPSTPNPLTLQTGGVIGYSRRPASFRVGYMGSTGFGAILQEHKTASLWEPDGHGADGPQQAFWYGEGPGRRFATSILAWLPRQHLLEEVVDYLADLAIAQAFSDKCTMYHFVTEFWKTFAESLAQPSQHASMCEIITGNTQRAVLIPSSNEEWLASFSGRKTRWEGIGEIFIAMGSAAFAIPEHDPLYRQLVPHGSTKKSFACTMLECADACSMLADEVSVQSSIFQVQLLDHIVTLQSILGGDTSSELWKRVGALSASVTGLGLHLKASEAESRSSLYRETRSLVFVSAFGTDKSIATFQGRPPCLSGRFASIDSLLDVSMEDLLEESSVAELGNRVDEHGWNKDGKIYHATVKRANYILLGLRDEIIELSLSPRPPKNFGACINDLRYRLDDSMRRLPAVFHGKFDKTLILSREKAEVVHIAAIQLVHLQNIFLVERIDHAGKDNERLLQAAREMLAMVVLFWSERDRYPSYRDINHWWICCYGIPAASSLAIDLWLQTLTPNTNPATAYRAGVIQNLSLFVACLEWVGPDEGNYILCAKVAKMIQNILERALAPNPEPPLPAPSAPPGFDLADISLADMPAFGQEWENWFDVQTGWTSAMQY